jgi:hypothetical protein
LTGSIPSTSHGDPDVQGVVRSGKADLVRVIRSSRLLAAAVTVVVAGAVSTSPATAAPPFIDPPRGPASIDDSFVLPDGEACPFEVTFSATGKGKAIFFENGKAIFTSPGLSVTFASASTSVTVQATGSFHDQSTSEGDDGTVLIDTVAVGHNVFFGSFRADDGSVSWGAYSTIGRVTITLVYDAATGEPLPALDFDTSRAQVTDLCAAVAP